MPTTDDPRPILYPRLRRYEAYAGFVTTPRYFDDSPQQFLEVSESATGVLQRVLHVPDYEYNLEDRADNFDLLEEAAMCLAQSHCQVVGQVGSNWVHCLGNTGPDEIASYCDALSERIGVPFLMAGHCLVEALRAVGASAVTVANGYFRPDWSAGINKYLQEAGFEILWAGDLIDQGLLDDHQQKLDIEAATLWDYPNNLMLAAATKAYESAMEADAIVQTGAGFRMLDVIDTVEGLAGVPVVASDTALYWAMLRELGLKANPGYGVLLSEGL